MQFHVVCLTPNSRNADIIDYEISLCIPYLSLKSNDVTSNCFEVWVGANLRRRRYQHLNLDTKITKRI